MTDQPSGNPRWEPATGRGVPAVPPPVREVASLGEQPMERPTQSVASWFGWSPTRWRSEGSVPHARPAWTGGSGSSSGSGP